MNLLTRDVPPRSAWALEQAGIHPLLARLYAARGVQSKDELDDALNLLLPPASMLGTQEAAKLLADAEKRSQAIVDEAKKRAEEAMQNRGTDFDLALAQSEFAMAAAQLAAIARFRRKK